MKKPNIDWTDDLLGRQENANWLTTLVLQRYNAYHTTQGSPALSLALDADWGAGKSFFVDRWSADLERQDHPVIHFDAWANDLSDDPLIGFLAQLQKELKPLLSKRPLIPTAQAELNQKVDKFWLKAKKAAVPAMGIIASGVVKKYAGFALEDITEVLSNTQDLAEQSGEHEDDAKRKKPAAMESISKATDKFLELAMKSHSDKQQSINEMRSTLEDLLDYLASKSITKAPLFIFIDELDRCRPDYAIRLLEGMKHIFNARGVCFVVSTNLQQLSSAVKAVYGSEFDAYRYLKKFFSFEYLLPAPDNLPYARKLLAGSAFSKIANQNGLLIIPGLPSAKATQEETIAYTFSLVADGMDLNLRSQRQVFEQAEAALSGFSNGDVVVLLYLFFLCAVFHSGVTSFDKLFNSVGVPTPATDEIKIVDNSIVLEFQSAQGNYRDKQRIFLREVLQAFHQMAAMPFSDANKEAAASQSNYPRNLLAEMTRSTYSIGSQRYMSMVKTGLAVRFLGFTKFN